MLPGRIGYTVYPMPYNSSCASVVFRTPAEVREVVAVGLDDAILSADDSLHPAGNRLLPVRQVHEAMRQLLPVELRGNKWNRI